MSRFLTLLGFCMLLAMSSRGGSVVLARALSDDQVAAASEMPLERVKRQQLTPTLTVDVGPPSADRPVSQTGAPVDFYFPVDSPIFNFSCTIKHPSYRYSMSMTREQISNSE